jgi:hypothetical protein
MSYVAGTAKWGEGIGTSGGRPITWSADYFDALTVDPSTDEGDFDAALQLAFDRWEGVASIDFEFDNSGASTDISIGAQPYEFPVAGLARITTGGAEITDVDIFFSTNIEWAPFGTGAPDFFGDFYAVALHEIGHGIGLEHVPDENEIMNATIFASDLGNGDIAAAQYLYGRDEEDAPLAEAEQIEAPARDASGGGGGGGGGLIAILLGLVAFAFGFGPAGAALAAGSLPTRNDDDDSIDIDTAEAPDLDELIPTVPMTHEHYIYLGGFGEHTGLAGCTCCSCNEHQMEDEESTFLL